MKKSVLLLLAMLSVMLLCSCVRTGEKDSVDFLSSMMKSGFDCKIEETVNDAVLRESCYINGCKLSLYSNSQGKLVKVGVTYYAENSVGFQALSRAAVSSFCSFSNEDINAVFKALEIADKLPDDSMGVKQCDTEWYGFAFSCDEVGGTLVIRSYRSESTSAPEVTLNTTVPFVRIDLSEKASS